MGAPARFALVAGLACACAEPPAREDDDLIAGYLAGLPAGDAQRERLCARPSADAVRDALCAPGVRVRSLPELMRALDVELDARALEDGGRGLPGFSLLAHSSALPSRSVNSLNPGVVVVSLPRGRPELAELNGDPGRLRDDGNVVSVAFARGDQLVEIAVTPRGGEARFYLLRYERACDEAGTCTLADRLSEETERGWTRWSLYDDADLANTALDCLHCHQPAGPGTPRIYRMQELENPWTHWLANFTLGGRVLLDDVLAGNPRQATFAGVPRALVARSNPVAVEDLMRFTRSEQPNVFPAPAVEAEVIASNGAQPRDNAEPGASAAWDEVYACAVRGDAIPPPYHDVKVTDADAMARARSQWALFDAGLAVPFPDVRAVFHPEALAGMSHRPAPGLDGRALLVHACAQCHNARLDQVLTRAHFDATNIDALADDVKERAIERLRLPAHDPRRMPPALFRDLSHDEIERAVAALR